MTFRVRDYATSHGAASQLSLIPLRSTKINPNISFPYAFLSSLGNTFTDACSPVGSELMEACLRKVPEAEAVGLEADNCSNKSKIQL